MKRPTLLAAVLAVLLLPIVSATGPAEALPPSYQQGAPGIGDPYFPLDGNGGYDVGAYDLELGYDPDTDVLTGLATIDLRAKRNLSRFNFDLDGLTVHSVTVDGVAATFQRGNGELRITPSGGIAHGERVQVVVDYSGIPQPLPAIDGGGGWLPTDDGVLVAGEPHVAAVWFPANDHPRDKARFRFEVTVPDGLEVVANGALVSQESDAGLSTWVWNAPAPMAPYLATVDIGEFDLTEYSDPRGRPGGIDYVDAVDTDLLTPVAPHTGTRFAFSQAAPEGATFKRLRRTIAVPGGGATLSFWVNRQTETNWDFVAVEARTDGETDYTTLPDLNGHTSDDTGDSCPYWLGLHPRLTRYQAPSGGGCTPAGTTGVWNAVSGSSDGWEQWSVDLADFAGSTAEVSISYISDDTVQGPGVAVDDIEVSTGEGTTSFETDGDELDGWQVPGAPPGSDTNVNDWITGTAADGPTPAGVVAQTALARQPEMLSFLSTRFGPYPFADGGGIVDDFTGLGFALENQTRPIYPPEIFGDPIGAESTIVHELAHQWYGDRVAVSAWQHIWLNEGFATYAEWLWAQREGLATAQEIFDFYYSTPAGDPLWHLRVGDPGPRHLFDAPVYLRGGMTLHALRLEVGNADFFTIMRRWAAAPVGRPTTTHNFQALAERVSGRQLDTLFHEWLFTTHKPALTEAGAEASGPAVAPSRRPDTRR